MKFMICVKATPESEAAQPPSAEMLTEMMKYNEELVKAGVMLDGAGLRPTSQAKRVHFNGKSRSVVDGPFTETKEIVAGYWLWQCKSIEEAVEWVKRCPNPMFGESDIDIRPLYGIDDFPEVTPETRALHDKLQAQAKLL